MSDLRVLQVGRSRGAPVGARRSRRRRRTVLPVLAAVITVAALLIFMAPKTQGPTTVRIARRLTAGPPKPAFPTPQPPPSGYGSALAPVSDRVNPKLQQGLRSGLLFDIHTGRVLWESNPDQPLPIASLTKMMTALVVAQRARPSASVLITPQAVHFSGSGVGLLPLGQRVPLEPLLYGLLLPSGNDAAIALAQHVAHTQARFVDLMNTYASQLGLGCTHFSNVSGITDAFNYSCTPDLAVIAHALLEQPRLRRIVASRSASFPFPIKGGKLFLYNNNPMLLMRYPGADGVKTGYTVAAGQCLVASARRGSTWLGVVLLHSGDTYDQAQALLNAGFAKLGPSPAGG